MKILIVGCGYLGTKLAERLAGNGHEIWGLRRNWDDAGVCGRGPLHGVKTITADLLNPESLKNLPVVHAAVFCQAPGKEGDYERVYYQGTRNILSALWKQEIRKLIMISSTSVYAQKDASWVDELSDTGFEGTRDPDSECLLRTEDLVLSESRGIIFRLGGIYGPSRNRLRSLKEGKLKPSFSEAFVNRIHVEDAAAGIQLLLDKGRSRELYLGVDNFPSTQKEFYEWLCPKLGLPATSGETSKETARGSNKRCSNKKIKELGLKLKYPTFREGYEELILNALTPS